MAFGRTRLIGSRMAVIKADGSRRELRFDRAILVTGSLPSRPSIPGADLPGVLDSTGLIEIDAVPESLASIGGGSVGVEMA
ncbi:MAG: FAD-dependent oxidoreductase [Acidihalobacter sp.]|uniref:FAD-dependent oxidoreductase n=1 Tax=Acidihalobacter sp. TaxID=1872108 RepID=UPI00307F1E90